MKSLAQASKISSPSPSPYHRPQDKLRSRPRSPSPSPFPFSADVRRLVYWEHDLIHQSLRDFQTKGARFWIVPITPLMPCGQATGLATGCPLHIPKDGQPMADFVQMVRQSGKAEGAGVQTASDEQCNDAGAFHWKAQLYSLAGLGWLE